MTSTMLRRCLTAAVALAALGAVVTLAPVSSAEAGPEVSPFAGTYVWGEVPVTISDGGQIKGSFGTSNFYKVSINGRVSDDGSYSFTKSVTYEDQERRGGGPPYVKSSYEFAGNMTLDADGNIVGTKDTGGSFVWLRQ